MEGVEHEKGRDESSVSAGSSQREASVTWTPQVMVPSGAAVAGPWRTVMKVRSGEQGEADSGVSAWRLPGGRVRGTAPSCKAAPLCRLAFSGVASGGASPPWSSDRSRPRVLPGPARRPDALTRVPASTPPRRVSRRPASEPRALRQSHRPVSPQLARCFLSDRLGPPRPYQLGMILALVSNGRYLVSHSPSGRSSCAGRSGDRVLPPRGGGTLDHSTITSTAAERGPHVWHVPVRCFSSAPCWDSCLTAFSTTGSAYRGTL
jgi:hypothetical protein